MKNKIGYIYLTTNLINNKKYIGLHRWKHNYLDESYLGSGTALKSAIEKYGENNFKVEILEWCYSEKELGEREKYWIDYYNAVEDRNYYNLKDGGTGLIVENNIKPNMTDTQLKNLEKGRHKPMSDYAKRLLSQRRKGVVVSQETRKKLSECGKNKKCMNNGTINKMVKLEEIDNYLNNGWSLGQIKIDRSNKIKKFQESWKSKDRTQWREQVRQNVLGRKWITKNGEDKQIRPEELDTYLKDGWTRGRANAKGKK